MIPAAEHFFDYYENVYLKDLQLKTNQNRIRRDLNNIRFFKKKNLMYYKKLLNQTSYRTIEPEISLKYIDSSMAVDKLKIRNFSYYRYIYTKKCKSTFIKEIIYNSGKRRNFIYVDLIDKDILFDTVTDYLYLNRNIDFRSSSMLYRYNPYLVNREEFLNENINNPRLKLTAEYFYKLDFRKFSKDVVKRLFECSNLFKYYEDAHKYLKTIDQPITSTYYIELINNQYLDKDLLLNIINHIDSDTYTDFSVSVKRIDMDDRDFIMKISKNLNTIISLIKRGFLYTNDELIFLINNIPDPQINQMNEFIKLKSYDLDFMKRMLDTKYLSECIEYCFYNIKFINHIIDKHLDKAILPFKHMSPPIITTEDRQMKLVKKCPKLYKNILNPTSPVTVTACMLEQENFKYVDPQDLNYKDFIKLKLISK